MTQKFDGVVTVLTQTKLEVDSRKGIHFGGDFVCVTLDGDTVGGELLPLGAFPYVPTEGSRWHLLLEVDAGIPWIANPSIILTPALGSCPRQG